MKLPVFSLLFSLLILFFGCRENYGQLSYYKIDEVYLNTYKADSDSSKISLKPSNSFQKDDSILIDISFSISYCDSNKAKFSKAWVPNRGYKGLIEKISSFSIVVCGTDDTFCRDIPEMQLIKDSIDYKAKKSWNDSIMASTANRPGCRIPLKEIIEKINSSNRCYNQNSLNSLHLLYGIDKNYFEPGMNRVKFTMNFGEYQVEKIQDLNFKIGQ